MFSHGDWARKAANVLNATIGFTIGDASMNVTAHEIGSPLSIKRRTTGTIPHSQIGKQSPRSPLTSVAKKAFLGSSPVITFDGMNAAIAPEISEPIRTNGSPS